MVSLKNSLDCRSSGSHSGPIIVPTKSSTLGMSRCHRTPCPSASTAPHHSSQAIQHRASWGWPPADHPLIVSVDCLLEEQMQKSSKFMSMSNRSPSGTLTRVPKFGPVGWATLVDRGRDRVETKRRRACLTSVNHDRTRRWPSASAQPLRSKLQFSRASKCYM